MAIIDVPYIVEFGNETEKRQWKKTYGAVGTFEIEEVCKQEAPVAIKWISNYGSGRVRSNLTRWHDNSHWLPLEFMDRETGIERHLTLKAYQLMVGRSFSANGHLDGFTSPTRRLESSQLKQYFKGEIKELASRKPTEKYSWSNHEKVLDDIENTLADTTIIDGHLWTRCPEPILTLSGMRDAPSIIATAKRPAPNKNGMFFRFDRLDDFLSQIEFEQPGTVITNIPDIEILLPETIHFNDEKHSLLATAGKLLELSKDLLPLCEWEESKCWYDLRRAQKNVSADIDTDVETLAILIEMVKTTFNPYFEDAHSVRTMVSRALNRWNLRPMELMNFAP
ncbi:hypothetical protein [Mesorhizobium sp. SP-1A]|uniref:hypothetical protein n=1 Tax=Mesorhizobium sp. SP-1A TaxID=3077840 RepID=UPI0028F7050C|nr:hypothetical protein [Mesorhizobium sp. SP-1A]